MITRFAPSPTGPLHLGHAYAAIYAHDMARAAGGQFLLRIEDIDQTRARPEWEQQIYDDLTWLGLTWDGPALRQSDRMDRYEQALVRLWDMGVLYPCTCNRRDILAAVAAPQEGGLILTGPDGLIYPGTCRPGTAPVGPLPRDTALRLNMKAALDHIGKKSFSFLERGAGPAGEHGEITISDDALVEAVGDVVLARRDMGTSYHLAVVVDDADQGITDVTRGADLFEATKIHVVLQSLLGLPSPTYHHHLLLRDDNGKRLAKRDDARAIAKYRAEGASPEDIRRRVGLSV
ncbi:tRNA glutamyl-Q(34) synthetase GluQRS [Marivivens marinus]|uniref:tRNA glutamyl-Q(34) synthetase GluQRS n=1 Tax=Marivivens marinus TaxID=3110173 RepID=UPI003B847FDA